MRAIGDGVFATSAVSFSGLTPTATKLDIQTIPIIAVTATLVTKATMRRTCGGFCLRLWISFFMFVFYTCGARTTTS